MTTYQVTYVAMLVDADTPEEAVARAEDGGGGNWEAVEYVAPLDLGELPAPEQRVRAFVDATEIDELAYTFNEEEAIVHVLTLTDLRDLLAEITALRASAQQNGVTE